MQLKLLWLSSSCFSARFFLAVAMEAGQSSSSRRRPGEEEIDRVLELIRLQNQVIQALTPHVNAQSQPLPPPNTPPPAPIPGAPPSSHDPRCFSNAPSNAPSKYPSACHLAFYKLLENMHNLWERSVLAKWVLHESNLHCNQAFNKLHFNALQFMF